MPANVIQLPRPRALRPSPARLGYYLRIGRNDHREVAELMAEGERAYLGLIVDAPNAHRHRDLIADALRLGLDVVLDPKSQAAAFPGGYTDSLGRLPWGLGRRATLGDYSGPEGARRADEVAQFADDGGFTAVISPTHVIQGPDDLWFAADRMVVARLRTLLPSEIAIIYSLALPMRVLRDPDQRQRIVDAMRGVPLDVLWLKIENFGADATGEKVRAYIEAMSDFNALGVPTIADHVGGIPGLALLAFGAVGGMAHGVMMLEGFKASSWRREAEGGSSGFTPKPRVYLPGLDMLVKPELASAFLEHSTRVRGLHACRDPPVLPAGLQGHDGSSHATLSAQPRARVRTCERRPGRCTCLSVYGTVGPLTLGCAGGSLRVGTGEQPARCDASQTQPHDGPAAWGAIEPRGEL